VLSPPQAALYARGYTEIVNVDYSAVVIRKMAARHAADCPRMAWLVGDMRDLGGDRASAAGGDDALRDTMTRDEAAARAAALGARAADGAFDAVIDKASLDALVVDEVRHS
jgi:hypothetical protein